MSPNLTKKKEKPLLIQVTHPFKPGVLNDSSEKSQLVHNSNPIREKNSSTCHATNDTIDSVLKANVKQEIDLQASNETSSNKDTDVMESHIEHEESDNEKQDMDIVPCNIKSSSHISPRRSSRYNTRRNKRWKATVERCRYITRQNKRRKIKVEYDE